MTRSIRTAESFGTSAAVPSAWRARRIAAGGVTLAAYETGSDASGAPSVLLLHGLGHWTDAAWGRLVPHLDPALRYVAFDLPGFGASDKPDVRYDRAFFRRVMDDAVAALGLERFGLVGHSLGGFIAADWAGAHPDRVTHLALIAPAGFSRSPRHMFFALLAHGAARRLSALRPSKRFVERILHRAVADPASIDAAHIERAWELSQELAVRRAFAGVYAGALETFVGTREVVRAFGRYAGPVLCGWGERDRYIPITSLRDVLHVYPQAVALLLHRSGHVPMMEEPERLGAELRAFLRRD
ncbi:MAG TPA: alpha/beta fold hydrolase [Candidatus Elarobacter sp.]|nr:alpha/beta fold hydrolase [Dongiaceae bacterium]HZW52809.1 alpha/beta fold hydrolase [Candidatus Elarobacter sp.]